MLNLSGRELLSLPDPPYGRREYVRDGLALMLVKYTVDFVVIKVVTGLTWTPIDYVLSLSNLAASKTAAFPFSLSIWLLVWAMLFVCVGIVLSVRRAKDAGLPTALVVAFFLPLLNYALMLALAALPTRSVRFEAPAGREPSTGRSSRALALGIVSGVASGVLLVAFGVLAIKAYGWTLFLASPFVVGAMSAFVARKADDGGADQTGRVVMATLAVLVGTVLLIALEGFICIIMAAPVAVPLAFIGGAVGRDIARASQYGGGLSMMLLLVPAGHAVEHAIAPRAHERVVMSSIEIAAPPSEVWPNVISFSEISAPAPWYFRTGLAYPLRARIDGSGVGAVRHCEFTTGAFIEPITAWDAPWRLAFDVRSQPAPLQEWSPYADIYAPHVTGFFTTSRGEFRLVEIPGGTRLEGRTWYSLQMAPRLYWTLPAEAIVHRIHVRVLEHIRAETEKARARS